MAAVFDAKTGKTTPGCRSAELKGFNYRPWFGSVVTRDPTGSGNVLYVGEFGRPADEHGPASAIGILKVTTNGTSCTLTESANSPQLLSAPGTLSVGAYPPRPF